MLRQLADRARDRVVHPLPISRCFAENRVPVQTNVGGTIAGLQDQGLLSAILTECIVGGVAEQIMQPGLPDPGLNDVDYRRHAPMKLLCDLDRELIVFHGSTSV